MTLSSSASPLHPHRAPCCSSLLLLLTLLLGWQDPGTCHTLTTTSTITFTTVTSSPTPSPAVPLASDSPLAATPVSPASPSATPSPADSPPAATLLALVSPAPTPSPLDSPPSATLSVLDSPPPATSLPIGSAPPATSLPSDFPPSATSLPSDSPPPVTLLPTVRPPATPSLPAFLPAIASFPAPPPAATASLSHMHSSTGLEERTSLALLLQEPSPTDMPDSPRPGSGPAVPPRHHQPPATFPPRHSSPPNADEAPHAGGLPVEVLGKAGGGVPRQKVGLRLTGVGDFPRPPGEADARQRPGRKGHLGRLNEQVFSRGPQGTPNPGGGQMGAPHPDAGVFTSLPDADFDVTTSPPVLEGRTEFIDKGGDGGVQATPPPCILCSGRGGHVVFAVPGTAALPVSRSLIIEKLRGKEEEERRQQQYGVTVTKSDNCVEDPMINIGGVTPREGGGWATREGRKHRRRTRPRGGEAAHHGESNFSTNVHFNTNHVTGRKPASGEAAIGHVRRLDGLLRARRRFSEEPQPLHDPDPDGEGLRRPEHTHPQVTASTMPRSAPSLISGRGCGNNSPFAAPCNGEEAAAPHNGSQKRRSLAGDASQVGAGTGEGAQSISPQPRTTLRLPTTRTPVTPSRPQPFNNGWNPSPRPPPKQPEESNIPPLMTSTDVGLKVRGQRRTNRPEGTMGDQDVTGATPQSSSEGQAEGDIKPPVTSQAPGEEEEEEEELLLVLLCCANKVVKTNGIHTPSTLHKEVLTIVQDEEEKEEEEQQQQQQEQEEEEEEEKVKNDEKKEEEDQEEWSVSLSKDSHANQEEEEEKEDSEEETPIKIQEEPAATTGRKGLPEMAERKGSGAGKGGKTVPSASSLSPPAFTLRPLPPRLQGSRNLPNRGFSSAERFLEKISSIVSPSSGHRRQDTLGAEEGYGKVPSSLRGRGGPGVILRCSCRPAASPRVPLLDSEGRVVALEGARRGAGRAPCLRPRPDVLLRHARLPPRLLPLTVASRFGFQAPLPCVPEVPQSDPPVGVRRRRSRRIANEGVTLSSVLVSAEVVIINLGNFAEFRESIIKELVSPPPAETPRKERGRGEGTRRHTLVWRRGGAADPPVSPLLVISCDAVSATTRYLMSPPRVSAASPAHEHHGPSRGGWRGKRSVEAPQAGDKIGKRKEQNRQQALRRDRDGSSETWKLTGKSHILGQHLGRRRRGARQPFSTFGEAQESASLYSSWLAALTRRSHKGGRKAEAANVLHFVNTALAQGYPVRRDKTFLSVTEFQNLTGRKVSSSSLNINKKVFGDQSGFKHKGRAEKFSPTSGYFRPRSPRATLTPRRAQRSPPRDVSRLSANSLGRAGRRLSPALPSLDLLDPGSVPGEGAVHPEEKGSEEAGESVGTVSLGGEEVSNNKTRLSHASGGPRGNNNTAVPGGRRGSDHDNVTDAGKQRERGSKERPVEPMLPPGYPRDNARSYEQPETSATLSYMSQARDPQEAAVQSIKREEDAPAPRSGVREAESGKEMEAASGRMNDSKKDRESGSISNSKIIINNNNNSSSNKSSHCSDSSNSIINNGLDEAEEASEVNSSSSSGAITSSSTSNSERKVKNDKRMKIICSNGESDKTADSGDVPLTGVRHPSRQAEMLGNAATGQHQAGEALGLGSHASGLFPRSVRRWEAQNLTFIKEAMSGAPRHEVPTTSATTLRPTKLQPDPTHTLEGKSGGRLSARGPYLRQEKQNRPLRPNQSRWLSAYLPSGPWAARVRGNFRGHSRTYPRAHRPLLPLTHKKTTVRTYWGLNRDARVESAERWPSGSWGPGGLVAPVKDGGQPRPGESGLSRLYGPVPAGAAGGLHQAMVSGERHPHLSQPPGNHQPGPHEGRAKSTAPDRAHIPDGKPRGGRGAGTPTTFQKPSRQSIGRESVSPTASPRRVVPILGLFDLTVRGEPRLGGRSELAAAQLALRHINEQQVIPGHTLVMFHNDTQCDSGSGVDAFFHALYTSRAKMRILLGAACTEVTESLAAVVHYWNIVQVSFGSVSPALSDRSSFPRFIRTVAPDSSHNAARLAFLTHHSWSTVTTISENHDLYTLALNELMPALEAANISLQATVTLSTGDYTEHLYSLKEKDCRIFIASFSATLARKVFCQAYHLGMYGADYAWVLSGAPQDSWWRDTAGTNCTSAQLVEAVQGVVLVAAHGSIIGTNASKSGLTNSQFLHEFSRTGQPLTEYVTHTYDALWAIALALRQMGLEAARQGSSGPQRRHAVARREVNAPHLIKVAQGSRKQDDQACSSGLHQLPGNSTKPTMTWILGRLAKLQEDPKQGSLVAEEKEKREKEKEVKEAGMAGGGVAGFELDTFDYSREDLADQMLETLQGLRFRGVSGPISFDCPDRVGVTAFYQVQDGEPVKVALYHPEEAWLDLACPGCRGLVWPGGDVPTSRVFKLRVDTVAPAAFIIMSSLATLGILLALAFLIFNLTYRRLKYIKLSSPRLNNTTVVGCVLVYTAVILLGLDHATLPGPHTFPIVCTARAYLLSAGFSLAFGSMFTKTYRVHQIFTRSNSAGVVRNKLLKDKQLIALIMVLLVVDVVIVSAWVAVDPMTRHLHNLTLEVSAQDRGVVYQPQVEVCRSEHTREWLGAFYVYKGLLVAVGVYMAWETRHVKIPALNDSQYIGMSVYNVVITSIIVIVAANIIGERTTLAYVIITTLIFTSTTTTLCLLFIPKILVIWRRAEGDPIVESMGLKIQYNTRRLLTEDKREKYYRAEVQNKVYRREMLKLDQDLHKLHLRVEAPGSPTSSTGSFGKQESISSGPSDNYGRGRGETEGGRGGSGGSESEAAGWRAGGSADGEARVLVLGAPHTQYLRSDDATARRVKRERLNRSLHRSLPSLPLGCSPEKASDTRLPADGAEDDSESASCGPSQVFFDALRFHEDQEEARRQAEEEDGEDDDENSPRPGTFPSSPHPLQRSRLVKRSPIKPRPEPEDEGIVDLRYTLNFSTPLLHGVTEADLPFSISTHVHHGPRVSFMDQDAHHYYDAGRERRKSSLSSYSSPEVRRPRNTCSSTDIRLQIECSSVLQDEKLSPVVEYRVNDLDVLCPSGQKENNTQRPMESVAPAEKREDPGGGTTNVCTYASNGALNRTPATRNTCSESRHARSPKKNASKPPAENATVSPATRPAGHIFSTVIVHHMANVHI